MTFTPSLRRPLRWLVAGLLLTSPALSQTPAKPQPTSPAPATKPPVAKPGAAVPTKPQPASAAPAKSQPAKPQPAKPKPTAVPPAEAGVRYRSGKTQLDQGNYAAALAQLEPLAQPTARFARAADAAYLAAVANARLKQWPEAEQLLNLLRTEYPAYPNMPDALFLQAQVSFEQEDFDTALKTLTQLPADKLVAEREAMKATYLPRIKERNTWQRNLRRYPDDATLARAYADHLIAGGAFTDADRPQLDELIAKFSLDPARYTPRPRPVSVKKTSYNVAVLLPFELADPSWQTQRKNQFVTDLYAGLRLAQDSLQRAGRPIQLFAYDTGADTLTLKQTLALPELAGMDMLIGPVYKSGAKLLSRYAREHQIVCVNPLSQDGDLVLDNQWHYLFAPSSATQGRVAAQFALNAFGAGRPGLVLYEDSKDDADFAAAYKTTFEEQGGKISALRRFNPDVDESLAAAFAGPELAASSHVVVVSDNRRIGPYALRLVQQQPAATRPGVLAPGSWLDNPRLDVSQLNGPATYFIQPKYYDEQALGFRRFRQLYLQRQHLPPSVFASQGFELLLYFGNVLFQYGPAFQTGLSSAPQATGAIFEGESYPGGAHDNQVVPIVKLSGLEYQVMR
ncbi:ABC transporter substrate-binding protein [Microvirga sp. STS02]|uniref:ABC transporter substrate-binding protein n=1 Tax=Hymenobacter negativus TaxID=2795026 RepID=UPI0018DE2107|nr:MULTISPECIES: ABC transporter substrate-binding protein [Bacteria]MBH8571199.1 ABC transporter substrate-binding protein [Hymenobacter negativus]MBR7210936.1 ABC transporter substrate-binding protein [Microvirga sp. STS02]